MSHTLGYARSNASNPSKIELVTSIQSVAEKRLPKQQRTGIKPAQGKLRTAAAVRPRQPVLSRRIDDKLETLIDTPYRGTVVII